MKNENRTVRRAWRRARLHLVLGAMIFLGGRVWADEVKTVTVVYTCSNNGMLKACACPGNPRGGLARRASVLREIRSEVGEILLLDSGDLLSHTKRLAKDEVGGADEVVLRIYGLLQYDAVAVGDQELANGRTFFVDRVLTSGLPTDRGNPKSDYPSGQLRSGRSRNSAHCGGVFFKPNRADQIACRMRAEEL